MLRRWRASIVAMCLISLLFQQQASANAALAPVENYVVNRAIAGVIVNRIAIAEGAAANDAVWLAKAANDPMYQATMQGVSSTMTAANIASTALGVGLAIAGAPVWLSLAATLGVVGLGAWIAYDSTGQANFSISQQGTGNKIVVANMPIAAPTYPGGAPTGNGYGVDLAVSKGANIYRDPSACLPSQPCYGFPPLPSSVPMKIGDNAGHVLVAGNAQDLGKYYAMLTFPSINLAYLASMGVTYTYESSGAGFTYADDGTPHWYVWIHESRQGCALPQCDPVNGLPNYDRTTFIYPTGATFAPGSYPGVYKDLDSAYAAIGPGLKAAKMSPQLLAAMADKAWQQAAAQPGYKGLPYTAANPITMSDVTTWQAANPTAMPTLDDLLRPAQNPTTDPAGVPISPTVQPSAAPSTNPSTGTNPNVNVINTPNVNVVNNPRVDLGPDPGTPDPMLEQTPDAGTILSPLTSLMPELRGFQTPGHTAECPKPALNVFGKTVVMDAQCTIAEQHRQAIGAVMLAVWMLVGLFILLSA